MLRASGKTIPEGLSFMNISLGSALEEAGNRYSAANPKSAARHSAARSAMPGGNTRTVLGGPLWPFQSCATRRGVAAARHLDLAASDPPTDNRAAGSRAAGANPVGLKLSTPPAMWPRGVVAMAATLALWVSSCAP